MECTSIDLENELVNIKLSSTSIEASSKDMLSFPFLWLRDNCRCSKCFHPTSKNRIYLLRNLDLNIKPVDAKTEDGNLIITWPDGHLSTYAHAWLRENCFESETRERQETTLFLPERLWKSQSMDGNVPRVNYNDFLTNDSEFLKWLVSIEQDGVCVIENAPTRTGVYQEVCNRVAYHKPTYYGDSFQVRNKRDPSNPAYTSGPLGLHTDLACLNYTPGVQMLHCIKMADNGGHNTLVDGFKVATDLSTRNPEYFRILRDTPVFYVDYGVDEGKPFYMQSKLPTIECDSAGKVTKINYSNHMRDAAMGVPLEQVTCFYKALLYFEHMLMDPEYCIRYLLNDGEILCFHNYRVLHGRDGYEMVDAEERHLEGAYVDWDEMRSIRRVLQKTTT